MIFSSVRTYRNTQVTELTFYDTTVGELIDKLRNLPPNATVDLSCDHNNCLVGANMSLDVSVTM